MRKTQICTVLLLAFATGTMAHAAPWPLRVAAQTASIVKAVQLRGNRRIPGDRIHSVLQTNSGNADLTTVAHDIRALYSLGYFDDVQFETESAQDGLIVIFVVKEKPLVRAIE